MLNLRHFAGQLIGKVLEYTGAVSLSVSRIRSTSLITYVYFHKPSSPVFAGSVSALMRRGYNPVTTADIEAAVFDRRELPTLPLHISLDDAWQSNVAEVVPIAQTLGVPITIFVPTEPILSGHYWWTLAERLANDGGRTVERLKESSDDERREFVRNAVKLNDIPREAMTRDELCAISQLSNVTIGSHSVCHPILTKCSDSDLEREVSLSKKILEEWIGRAVTCFSYPNGDHGEREMAALCRAGYRVAFTTEQRHGRAESGDPLALPRFALLNEGSISENVCRATGLWSGLLVRSSGAAAGRQTSVPAGRTTQVPGPYR